MLHHFITLLPFSFAFIYFIEFLVKKDKTETQNIFTWAICLSLLFLYADALYVTEGMVNFRIFVITDTFNHFITPLVPLAIFMMLYSYRHKREEYSRYYWLGTIAIFYGTACLSIMMIIGLDNTAAFLESYYNFRTILPEYDHSFYIIFWFLYIPCYYVLLAIELLIVTTYIIYYLRKKRFGIGSLFRFLFRGGEATPLILHCWISLVFFVLVILRMGMGRFFWMEHPNMSACLSVVMASLIFAYGNIGLISHMYEGTLREMTHPLTVSPLVDGSNSQEIPKERRIFEHEDEVTDQIIDLMEDKQLYKNPNLTIEDLALQLNTSPTLLNSILEKRMGCTFREYTNKLRLLHAQRYMVLHPNETQDRIAAACGFSDASSFSKKFRQFTNQTPREWLNASRQSSNNQV